MSQPKLTLPALPAGRHYRFHSMAKPSGAECNIDCDYCFYLHKSDLLQHAGKTRMDERTLDNYIRQYIEAQTGEQVVFSWQGGEPTLMGLAFYQKVVELQQRYAKPGQRIENDLQTNGITLNDNWISFLREANFHVGLSIDGPQDLHDIYRKSRSGKATFDAVYTSAQALHKANVPFAALCVVNRQNAKHPQRVYRFLADELGTHRIQFTPAVEAKDFMLAAPALSNPSLMPAQNSPRTSPDHPLSIVTPWSVDAADYGHFLAQVWDEWLSTDFGRIQVNLFETLIAQAAGMPAQTCTQAEFCGKGLALEHDGEVFSCDHFVYADYRLGNIHQQHLGDLAFSATQQAFGLAKYQTLPKQCQQCDYLRVCYGECPKNRLIKTQDGESGLNYLCTGLHHFYQHASPDVVRILKHLGYLPS